uniref:Kaurene synthase-like 2 n=1 Tax=Chamaecyparis formosensis TaxID=187461 RepID=A0A8F2T9R1_CHAFM|nr:kaurene synthase-like 2 [Chamaecyparis formosensis]
MAGLSVSSVAKRNTFLLNKAFQQRSVNYRPQPWVSCTPQAIPPVRAMTLIADNIISSVPRRTANYHSDLWSDDVLQSLNTQYHQAPPYQQWANNLVVKIKEMFRALDDGEISPSAYDTAWVAMVPAQDGTDAPHFPQAIKWLIHNQLEDGSWGLPSTFLLCDRLLCTLTSLVALLTWNTGNTNVEKGVRFIQDHLKSLETEESLSPDFEIIFPALMKKAESLGLSLPYSNTSLINKRAALLTNISMEGDIPTRMLNALEGLEEIIDWKKIMMFQSKDGSFLSSPASTACVLINTGDERCFSFLNNLTDKFSGSVPCLYPIDLLERLSLVDNIERLGIGRHFQEEIKVALDYVYGYWSEKGIGCGRESLFPDLNTTALGLRTLRVHGYNVSPEVLNNFKDEEGCFFTTYGQRHIEHRSILNLFRASDLALPGENIMDEARLFASKYLRESLNADNILCNAKVAKETEDALEYSWHLSISILEARNYIDTYDDIMHTLAKPYSTCRTFIIPVTWKLAKLYFNIEQSLHQAELKLLSSWWKKSRMIEVDFARQRIVETYFSVGTFEPEYSMCRINFTKIGSLVLVMDDIYDTYGTVEELITFREAIKRCDISLVDELPEYMKIIFKAWYEVATETNKEATKQQGRDMLQYIRKDWEMFVDALMTEREWSEVGYIPTMEEYLKTRCISVGLVPCALHPIFLMGEVITDNDLPIIHESSNIFQLVALVWRLKNDTATSEAEEARGQINSCMACYMNQNPSSTKEDALQYYEEILDHTLKQLNYEYFNLIVEPPKCGKRFIFNMRQCCMLLYKYKDGYGSSSNETKEYIRKSLIDPVHLW